MKHVLTLVVVVLSTSTGLADSWARNLAYAIDTEEGVPLATATGFGGGLEGFLAIAPTAVLSQPFCIRFATGSPCTKDEPEFRYTIDAFPRLSVIRFPVSHELATQRYEALRPSGAPIATGKVASENASAGVRFATQTPFGNVALSAEPANVLSIDLQSFVIESGSIRPNAIGAPVEHSILGFVGVIAEVAGSAAQVISVHDLMAALARDGYDILPELLSSSPDVGGIEDRALGEAGVGWLLTDFTSGLGYAGIFYGPGAISDPSTFDYSSEFELQIYEMSPDMLTSNLLTRGITVGSMREGVTLNAPRSIPLPANVATCVLHNTPSSGDQRIYSINFYSAIPLSRDNTFGTWSFNGIGPNIVGMEEGANICSEVLNSLNKIQRSEILGEPGAENQ